MIQFTRRKSLFRMCRITLAIISITTVTTACGKVDTTGLATKPSKQALTEKNFANTTANQAPDDQAAETHRSTAPQQSSEIPSPIKLFPDGSKVALTPPGSVLPFGKPATVATTNSDGRLLVWKVVVHDGVFIPRKKIKLLTPIHAENKTHFFCYAYDITFLGTSLRDVPDPLVLNGVPDTVNTAVAAPTMIPINQNGDLARRLVGGEDNACGIPDSTKLPTTESLLKVGYAYARGSVGAVTNGDQSDKSAAGISYHFDKQTSGVDKVSSAEPIQWK